MNEFKEEFLYENQINKIINGELELNMPCILLDISRNTLKKKISTVIKSIKRNKDNNKYINKFVNHMNKSGFVNEDIEVMVSDFVKSINKSDLDLNNLSTKMKTFLSIVIESTSKQNTNEKFKLEFIKYNGWGIKKLNGSGPYAKYLCNNKLMNKYDDGYTPTNSSKSLDFLLVKNDIEIYFIDKTTEEIGGAQTNQYNDAISALKQAKEIANYNMRFIGLLDGGYYKKKQSELNNFETDYVKICDIENVFNTLKKWGV
jgi:hypothetical protein